MQSYLTHLLADIRAAHRAEAPKKEKEPNSLEEYFREIDRWVSGDAEHTLSYYCDLKEGAFPPHDKLHEKDVRKLCEAFIDMLNSWGVHLDIPREVPLNRRYELMVGLLNYECTPMDTGIFVFDFCSGYAPGCKLKEFCPCLEIWEEEEG